eukprot:790637-Pelagomonas_calceolata.AAC.1
MPLFDSALESVCKRICKRGGEEAVWALHGKICRKSRKTGSRKSGSMMEKKEAAAWKMRGKKRLVDWSSSHLWHGACCFRENIAVG